MIASLKETEMKNHIIRPRNAKIFHTNKNGSQKGKVRSLIVLMIVSSVEVDDHEIP